MVQTDSPAVNFDPVEYNFWYLKFVYWLNLLNNDGGEETGATEENPRRRASEIHTHTESPNIQDPVKARSCTAGLREG